MTGAGKTSLLTMLAAGLAAFSYALAGQSGNKGGSVGENKVATRTENRATQCNQYVSFRFGYSACIPSGWRELDPGADPTDLVNFLPDRRARGVVIPSSGASITVIGPWRADIRNLEGWVESDAARETSRQTLDLCCRSGTSLKVVETTSVAMADKPAMLCVSDYFWAGQKPFKGFLTFWEGDPNRARYTKTLHDMILSLKVR